MSSDDNYELIVWSAPCGEKELATIRCSEPVECLAFGGDGRRLAFGRKRNPGVVPDSLCTIYDLQSGDQLGISIAALGHHGAVRSIAFAPDGASLLAAGWGRNVSHWNLDEGTAIAQWNGVLDGGLNSVAVDPQGRYFAVAGDDRSIAVWDLRTRKRVKMLERPGAQQRVIVDGLQFSHDGQWLVAASVDGGFVCSTRDWTWRERFGRTKPATFFNGVACHPTAPLVVFVGSDPELWDLESGKFLREFKGQLGRTTCGAFTPDGNRLATGGVDGTVKIWGRADRRGAALASRSCRFREGDRDEPDGASGHRWGGPDDSLLRRVATVGGSRRGDTASAAICWSA